MSGTATKLAGVQRKSRVLEVLLQFVHESVAKSDTRNVEGDGLVKHHVEVLQRRLRMQALDTDYTLKRVRIQIEALVNLIAQQDSMNNYDIALSGYRDASSMKTLAVVTMFFLPGSFIAALFSTPCFDWNGLDHTNPSIGVAPTPQFSLYWVITIPLTVLTFVLYFIWLTIQNRERQQGHGISTQAPWSKNVAGSGEGKSSEEEMVDEADKIAMRRQTHDK